MPFNYGFKLGSIQEISLLDADAITKRLKSLRRANKCRDRMTMFNRLPNDLQPRAPGGSQYNQLHAASLSKTVSALPTASNSPSVFPPPIPPPPIPIPRTAA